MSFDKELPDHSYCLKELSLAVFGPESVYLIEIGEIKSFYIFNYEC